MVSPLFFSQLVLVALVWLCVMLHWAWPSDPAAGCPTTPEPPCPRPQHHREPTPFAGLTRTPPCAACEQAHAHGPQPPGCPPPRLVPTRGRPRQVDTSFHFCPNATCAYRGWVSWGNLSANGHPSGGPWRQWHCTVCKGYVLETHGTLWHGKRVAPDVLGWAVGALAEGLGIRAVARGFEVDPHSVLQWLVEAAAQLQALSQYCLHDVRVTQVQLDALSALLRAVKDGEVSEAEALARLSRSPHWVWTAVDPVTKLLLTIDVGNRTLTRAQRVGHQVVQVLAPGCVPLCLTDGFKEYTTALRTHDGQWVHPTRRHATGAAPKPRWMPHPGLLSAQVIKTVRRRRLVRVTHRVVFGTRARVNHVLAACGWQINTAFVERLNLDIRQHVAAVGRRVATVGTQEAGVRQQLAVYHAYHHFCLPHTSLRQPLARPAPTNGTGSAKQWRPCTPAMAAGLTDHVWTLREVLLFRVPPWPQPAQVSGRESRRGSDGWW